MSARPPAHVRATHWCQACDKLSYTSRKEARRAHKVYHPGDTGMSAYPCPGVPGVWHYGHSHRKDRRWVA